MRKAFYTAALRHARKLMNKPTGSKFFEMLMVTNMVLAAGNKSGTKLINHEKAKADSQKAKKNLCKEQQAIFKSG
jgi:hypothetical protein